MSAPFPAAVVADPEAQLNFEALGLLLPQGNAQILQAGSGLALAATGTARKVDFGTASLVFPNSTTATSLTVNHALGVVPVAIVANCGPGAYVVCATQSYTTTTFVLAGAEAREVVLNTSIPVTWIAVG